MAEEELLAGGQGPASGPAEERPDRPRDEAQLDYTIDDSFPASNPPAWTSETVAGAPNGGQAAQAVLMGGGRSRSAANRHARRGHGPAMTGPGSNETAVRAAFAQQGVWGRELGSPLTGFLCDLAGRRLDRSTKIGRRILDWPGQPDLRCRCGWPEETADSGDKRESRTSCLEDHILAEHGLR
jgi:hypothetical protein